MADWVHQPGQVRRFVTSAGKSSQVFNGIANLVQADFNDLMHHL